MEKTFTISEFEEFTKEINPTEIILFSSAQKEEIPTATFEIMFDSISVGVRPNVLYLRGKQNFLKLYLVEKIIVDTSLTTLGRKITVVCTTGNSLQRNAYVFFLR